MDVRNLFERSLGRSEPPITQTAELLRQARLVRRHTRIRRGAVTAAAAVTVFLVVVGAAWALRPPSDAVPASLKGASATRSGLAWPSGVFAETYQAAGPADAFGRWRGRPVDVAVVATDRSTWAKLTSDIFVLSPQFFPREWPGQLVISLGMWPQGAGSMAECAAGRYADHFETFGRALASAGRAGSIVRIGWNANSDRWYWAATDAALYRECFRQIATAIRATAPGVLIDWTVAGHATTKCGGAATNCYPGDDVVDIIGVEMFDRAPVSRSAESFDAAARLPDSLYPMLDFARRHDKKLSVGSWSVAGVDNAVFVQQMLDFFRTNADEIAYEAYFNTCKRAPEAGSDIHVCGPLNPAAAAAYREYIAG